MTKKQQVVFGRSFTEELKKDFTKENQEKVIRYIISNIENVTDPRQYGAEQKFDVKATMDTTSMWGYDVDDTKQRLLAYLKDDKVIILAKVYIPKSPLIYKQNKTRVLFPLIQNIDYNNLISLEEFCDELGFNYPDFL
jgi:mRNA-degrading endonuclease RelE of RelBE toxin-antitoxin system